MFDTNTPAYEVGDVIAYEAFGGVARILVVTERSPHNGQPSFVGTMVDGGMEVWGYDEQISNVFGKARHAVVKGQHEIIDTIRRYLPSNYFADVTGDDVTITGYDNAGWTLDGYVIPRLASGLYYAKEISR